MFLTSVFVPRVVVPAAPHRDVGVAAQAALLHVAVVHAERDQYLAQLPEGVGRILRRPQVRLGDDLDERRAAAIEVETGLLLRIRKSLVERLAGIFFHVHAGDADPFCGAARGEFERAGGRQRQLVLGDLVALRQVGIEIVLAGENRLLVDRAVERQGRLGGKVDRPAVQDRQRPREPQAHRAHAGIRGMSETRAAAAENLRICEEPGVYFEPNDGFKSHEV